MFSPPLQEKKVGRAQRGADRGPGRWGIEVGTGDVSHGVDHSWANRKKNTTKIEEKMI